MEALDPKRIINTLKKVESQPWNANEKKANLIVTFTTKAAVNSVCIFMSIHIPKKVPD